MAAKCRLIVYGLSVTFLFATRNVGDNLLGTTGWVDPLDSIATVMGWVSAGVGTGYGAALVGGVLILIVERFDRWRAPSDSDVRRVAARYRQRYGDGALQAIGEHMQAAAFAPDRRHRRFLERVLAELSRAGVAEREEV